MTALYISCQSDGGDVLSSPVVGSVVFFAGFRARLFAGGDGTEDKGSSGSSVFMAFMGESVDVRRRRLGGGLMLSSMSGVLETFWFAEGEDVLA